MEKNFMDKVSENGWTFFLIMAGASGIWRLFDAGIEERRAFWIAPLVWFCAFVLINRRLAILHKIALLLITPVLLWGLSSVIVIIPWFFMQG